MRLLADGFTPGGPIAITRGGQLLDEPIQADPAGSIAPTLTLPGFVRGQQLRTYVATDQSNPALTAQVSVLVTATVRRPPAPERAALTGCCRISARGFFGGSTLYAHVVRRGKHGGRRARHAHRPGQGRLHEGPRAQAPVRSAAPRPAATCVQFDTFRRYKARSRRSRASSSSRCSPRRGPPGRRRSASARPADPQRERPAARAAVHGQLRRGRRAGGGTTRTPNAPPPRSRRPAAKSGISAWTS